MVTMRITGTEGMAPLLQPIWLVLDETSDRELLFYLRRVRESAQVLDAIEAELLKRLNENKTSS